MAEKNTSTLLIVTNRRRMEDVGLQVQTVPVFFLFVSLSIPFGFLLLILTAYPVSFSRFLRKRISSLKMNKSRNQVIVTSIKCTC